LFTVNGNRGTKQELCVSTKVSEEIASFQHEFPPQGVWCKKSKCTSGVGQKNPTQAPGVDRNPTPRKNLRLRNSGSYTIG